MPDAPVVFDSRGECSRGELAARVAALASAVEAVGHGRWLLVGERSDVLAAGLLALGATASVAVLPPNLQPGSLRGLAGGVRGVIASRDLDLRGLPAGLPRLDADAPAPLARPASEAFDRLAPWIELYTSGTTGEPRRSVKHVFHLEDEVAVLERIFGPHVPADARIFATVPPYHIYGLLFRVLWPLATGRPFQAETPLHVQEVVARMARARDSALVSTPIHLRHLAAGDGLRALHGSCRAVFSSGAPLDADTAKRITELLGVAPFEILGSTETGGVARRQRSVHGESWWPFPGVAVERDAADGTLRVTSTFVSEGEMSSGGRGRFRMGDRVEMRPDGSFRLLQRADRSVKIGGKRLSLPEMENELSAHPWVSEAALVARERGAQTRVAAAVVLSGAGCDALEREGRRALGRALSEHLSARFDPVLRPRAWRYVDALPRNAQGKIPNEAIDALFTSDGGGRSLRVARRLEVAPDLASLDGHFEGHPVVPGVTQVGWALEAASELLGCEPRVRGFEALKFPSVLRPGDAAELRVEIDPSGTLVRFSLRDGERVFASGRCLLAAHPGRRP